MKDTRASFSATPSSRLMKTIWMISFTLRNPQQERKRKWLRGRKQPLVRRPVRMLAKVRFAL